MKTKSQTSIYIKQLKGKKIDKQTHTDRFLKITDTRENSKTRFQQIFLTENWTGKNNYEHCNGNN